MTAELYRQTIKLGDVNCKMQERVKPRLDYYTVYMARPLTLPPAMCTTFPNLMPEPDAPPQNLLFTCPTHVIYML